MMRYAYEAVSSNGKSMRGSVPAESPDRANAMLSERGLTVTALHEQGQAEAQQKRRRAAGKVWGQPVKPEELILFTKQMATMLRAGIPVLRVFDILEHQTENDYLRKACGEIGQSIRNGSTLSRALRQYPKVFSPLYCSMVLAGETSGALPQVLQRLIYVIAHEHKVKTEVRGVMQYPILVLSFLVVAFILLIAFVVPRFAAVYLRSGVVLPLPTRICVALSELLRQQGLWLFLSVAVVLVGLYLTVRTHRGRYWKDRLMLKLPLIGPLLVKAALSRLAAIFAILQATGVGILDSLQMLMHTVGNTAIGRELERLQDELEAGHGIARPLSTARYFTPLFINMVAVGEETGKLDEMLSEISGHYDAEVEYASKRLTTALGPLLIVLLAALVGFFALAVYLPMWDLAKIATRGG
jgi:type IV pilus assembly protein PilC